MITPPSPTTVHAVNPIVGPFSLPEPSEISRIAILCKCIKFPGVYNNSFKS